jgi:hypothetical protein
MGGQYSREAIHKRLLDYDPADISQKVIKNDSELPSAHTLKKYAGKSYEHISKLSDLKDLVAEDHLQVWQGDDESIEQAVEQAVEEIGGKPTERTLRPYFGDRERFPGYTALFNSDTCRYSGGLEDLKRELEVTDENLRAYSDKDEHIEETMLYVHDQLGKKAPTKDELDDFLKNQPMLLDLETYRAGYSQGLNALFEKHGKEVNGSGSENDPIPLSDQDENLLWGMMLGDGCCKPGQTENENPRIEYTSTDRPQLRVLKERTDADIWTDNTDLRARGEKSKDHYRIRTKHLPNLEKFRKPYRTVLNGSADPNAFWTTWDGLTGETFPYSTWKMMDKSKRMKSKKARIPKDVEVSPELMMAWYLGDGTRTKKDGTPRITAEFPKEDYRRIQSELEEEVFDGLEHPQKASSIQPKNGRWSLTPLNPDYLHPGAQLGYTDHEEQRIIGEALDGELQREVGEPLRPDMIIDRKSLRINKPGAKAFFDYLPDHDDWDNVMPHRFPS